MLLVTARRRSDQTQKTKAVARRQSPRRSNGTRNHVAVPYESLVDMRGGIAKMRRQAGAADVETGNELIQVRLVNRSDLGRLWSSWRTANGG
jgi:hypothetical protein